MAGNAKMAAVVTVVEVVETEGWRWWRSCQQLGGKREKVVHVDEEAVKVVNQRKLCR